ncbi:MAG: hypothetical protein PVJ61_06270 [Dehalococcoidia bacterium]|jgi:hypothetical protein
MSTVSYQIIFNTKQDFKSEILNVLKQSYEDSYIDDYSAATLEDAIQIKYEKLLNNTRVIVGVEIILFEDLPELEILIASINDNLLSSSEIDAVFKFEDLGLFSKLDALHNDLFKIEMRLREAMTFIFIDTYGTDYYNLLKETSVKPRFERKSNLFANREQKESYLIKRFENEFFHILFDQYDKLGELKSIKLEDLVSIAEVAHDFNEFRSAIITRGIIKVDYLDFISSIKADMEFLEKVRNCFAHNRSPSEDDLINFERVKEELLKKIDDFLASLSQRE